MRLRSVARGIALAATALITTRAGAQVAPVGGTSTSTTSNGRAVGVTQHVSVTATARSYRVGSVEVTERVAPFSWRLTTPRVGVRVSGTPLALDAPGSTLNAVTPVRGRADFLLRVGDTLSVYGRAGSSPVMLDSTAVRAVSAAGTSVLDLASQGIGVPAQIGVRSVLSFPVRDVVLGVGAAVEREARPSGAGVTYWQGTTLRGEVAMHALLGERQLTIGTDVSYSRADSLGGRNQFPGGGNIGVTADLSGPLDAGDRFWFSTDAFYSRPFDNVRADQPTRLIPSGTLAGISGALLTDIGAVTLSPSVSVLREASSASLTAQDGAQRVRTLLVSGAWSVSSALTMDVPLGHGLTLSPEGGAVFGSVSSTFQQTSARVIGRRGRTIGVTSTDGFRDPVRGWWAGVGLSARF